MGQGNKQTNSLILELAKNLKSGTLEDIKNYYKSTDISYEFLKNVVENNSQLHLKNTIISVNKLEEKLKPFKNTDIGKDILKNKCIFQATHNTELYISCGTSFILKKVKILPDIIQFIHNGVNLTKIKVYNLKEIKFKLEKFVSTAKEEWLLAEQSLINEVLNKIYNVPIELNWLVHSKLQNKVGIFKTQVSDLIIGKKGASKVHSYVHTHDIEKDIIEQTYIKGYEDAIITAYQCEQLGLVDYDLRYYQNGGIYQTSIFE